MNKLEEKFINYVDLVCGFDSPESESFGNIMTDIDENGYACTDYGYSVKLEHILNIKPEENTLD